MTNDRGERKENGTLDDEANSDVRQAVAGDRRSGGGVKGQREVRTPQGTMVIVLIYAAATIGLWSYVYYQTLQLGGAIGGH